jgi:hypothetical protein
MNFWMFVSKRMILTHIYRFWIQQYGTQIKSMSKQMKQDLENN